MFNSTYILPNHVSHTHSTTVTEKRAPTDESVKLLREMEEAARQKVLETIVVSDTQFECVIHKNHDCLSDCDVYDVIYKLNGNKKAARVQIERYRNYTQEEVLIKIRDGLAESIANEMLTQAFNTIGWRL